MAEQVSVASNVVIQQVAAILQYVWWFILSTEGTNMDISIEIERQD